jgi:RHS repeat-associated protein
MWQLFGARLYNGGQTQRAIGNDVFDLTYDAESRLVEVKKNSTIIAEFTYDADGRRVKSVMDSETILFVGAHYEVKGSEITKYYFTGASRIAMRKYTIPQSMSVEYFLSDHLSSTSITTDADGNKVPETRYATGNLNTDYQYTGQRAVGEIGLHFYNARWYDNSLSRFTSADTIIPSTQGVQGWDRFAYTNNNPVRYTDPSGHCAICGIANVIGQSGVISFGLHLFGVIPDYQGIRIAESVVTDGNAIVAAGIAVQSQWYNSYWDHQGNLLSSSYGPAQITQAEIEKYGLDGQDLHSPSVAVQAMENRINDVLNACPACIERDKLILVALAQNGSKYALNALKNVSYRKRLDDGGLNWVEYFDSLNPKGNFLDLRAVGHHNFDSRFQLHLFMNNLEELGRRGWELPNLSSHDWDYINDLRWRFIPQAE